MAAFTEQNVTQDMLPELSDNNLRELGLNIGWRLRFRRAVSTELPHGDCFADSTPLGFNTTRIPYFTTKKKMPNSELSA